MSVRLGLASVVALAFLVSAGEAVAQTPIHRATLPGISISVDTNSDGGPAAGLFNTFSALIQVAGGRGRLDILTTTRSRAVLANSVWFAAPLARPGEYYLFDSTGFVLVRPASGTYSTFTLSDASYNYDDGRDGWPELFEFSRLRLSIADTALRWMGQDSIAPGRIYWHLDDQRTRGRLTVRDAPASELGVARWFGMSEALAHAPAGIRIPNTTTTLLTTVIQLDSRGFRATPINFVSIRDVPRPMHVEVDVARLMLPADFREVPWSESKGLIPTEVPADRAARWRASPEPH